MIERVTSSFNEHFLDFFISFFFFWGGGLAVIKPDLSRNSVKPEAAENYLASRN
jgi:hypothetical protein